MNIHIPSVVGFLKAMPIGRNRAAHLNLLANAIDCELRDCTDPVAVYLAVLDLFPYATRTWRPEASHQWSQGEPPAGLQNVQLGLFFTGTSTTTPHDQSGRYPCRALDIVHVTRLDGTSACDRASNIDWTQVRNWRV